MEGAEWECEKEACGLRATTKPVHEGGGRWGENAAEVFREASLSAAVGAAVCLSEEKTAGLRGCVCVCARRLAHDVFIRACAA